MLEPLTKKGWTTNERTKKTAAKAMTIVSPTSKNDHNNLFIPSITTAIAVCYLTWFFGDLSLILMIILALVLQPGGTGVKSIAVVLLGINLGFGLNYVIIL